MNKTRKGSLIAASIITIVASAFAIFGGLFCFLVGSLFDDNMIKKEYMNDENYTYVENGDDYYFTYMEDGEEVKVTEEDIEFITEIVSTILYVAGGISIAVSAAKLTLAIRILIATNREKYAKGSIISLLVLSALNGNIIELVLLVLAMCSKDQETKQPLGLNDIEPTASDNTI